MFGLLKQLDTILKVNIGYLCVGYDSESGLIYIREEDKYKPLCHIYSDGMIKLVHKVYDTNKSQYERNRVIKLYEEILDVLDNHFGTVTYGNINKGT